MPRNLILMGLLFLSVYANSQVKINYSSEVQNTLIKAGENRTELEKAIAYFEKKNNPLQLKALLFLIENMDIHKSINYSWVDGTGKVIAFDEFSYPTFDSATVAMSKLKADDMETQEKIINDVEVIKADFLIENVQFAFDQWKNSSYNMVSFPDFCEYILPYRVISEPLQPWREAYNSKFHWLNDTLKLYDIDKTIRYLHGDIISWWHNTTGLNKNEGRIDPLPALGSQQLLFRKKGPCSDVAILDVYALRSQGIPSSYDYIPFWGTSTGSHIINSVFDKDMKAKSFDLYKSHGIFGPPVREPAKVFRITYSKQKSNLANLVSEQEIPDGFLQTKNYIDVTAQYWKTSEIKYKLTTSLKSSKIAYVCSYSGGDWQPVWWSEISKDKVSFSNMSIGCPYLPALYLDGEIIPAGYPIIITNEGTEIHLKPNEKKLRTVNIKEQERYLIFRPDNKYKLLYWKNGWQLISEKVATGPELIFQEVPTNALLLLVPEYSKGKERPFTIDENEQREWW